AQKPLLRAYLNAEVRDQLVSGDVLAAQLWSTTAQQAIDAAPNLAFVYPAEGFPFYCDCAVILRESSRSRLAHQFLDYLLRPKVSRRKCVFTRAPRPPMEPPTTCCRRPREIIPPSIQPPRFIREGSGRVPCRLRPRDCETAFGRKLSLRSFSFSRAVRGG